MRPGTETLARIPLFVAFGPGRIAELNDLADLARVGPDGPLFQPGDQLQDLHILLSGYVAETFGDAGQPALTDVIAPVQPIGFASAMLGVTAPTGARTITSVRLVIIPAPDLRAMIQAEPHLGTAFLEHALTSLRTQTLDTCHLKLRSAVQRLASFLIGLAEGSEMNPARFVLPYEKRFLAARIGCTQENLSRAFAALRRLGVETQRGAVVLRDVEALRAYAGLASVRKAA